MPPITLAFVDEDLAGSLLPEKIERYVAENVENGYVLDGMQRLNTLKSASEKEGFDFGRPLFVNVIIAEKYDLLLYRMITLNNGQKPMTARHQIEMLTKGLIETQKFRIDIVSEKETETAKFKGGFRLSDIAAAYMAFLTNSVHNENNRIIETKLDEIIVGKVMDSDITDSILNFEEVIAFVDQVSSDQWCKDWLRSANNLIGFSVGVKSSSNFVFGLSSGEFREYLNLFEESFSALKVSKINVGKFRRDLSKLFIEKIDRFEPGDPEALTQVFLEETLVD